MAVPAGKFFQRRFLRFVTGILQRSSGPTEILLPRWRLFTSKHSKLGSLLSNARRLTIGSFITSSLLASRGVGFWSAGSQSETKESTMAEQEPKPSSSDAELIEEADRLYQAYEPKELHALLIKHKDSNNEEVLWRLCRATREVAQMSSTSAEEKKKLTYEAMEYAKRCLEINDKNFASHKWYAICISEVGDYEGAKKKISNAYVIRDHFQKSIELNPLDATSHHLMGLWCFTFADMPWYQRKIAAAIFGSPPTSTYQEAFDHFKKGEDISPGFYSKNLLMLGRTCIKLNDKEGAITYLNKAKHYDCKKDEDNQVVTEAKAHLKGLGIKV